jgi:head-tail adaptor
MAKPAGGKQTGAGPGHCGLKYPLGEYNRQVLVEQNQADPADPTQRDEYQALAEKWVPVFTRFARIAPLAGKEFWSSQQAQSDSTHQINLRGVVPGLTMTRHRLRMGQRVFQLGAVTDLNDMHVEHELTCVEGELRPGEQTTSGAQ